MERPVVSAPTPNPNLRLHFKPCSASYVMKPVITDKPQDGLVNSETVQSMSQAEGDGSPPLLNQPATTSRMRRLVTKQDLVMLTGLAATGTLLYLLTEALRRNGPRTLLDESGMIELAQLGLLISAICILGWKAKHHSLRALVVPLMFLLGAMLTRELDAALDLLVHGFWKYPAWALACTALVLLVRRHDDAVRALDRIRYRRTVGLFASAAFVILIQSRLLGRQAVWESALGEHYHRNFPRLVEEFTELVGYGLLLLACLDMPKNAVEAQFES